MAANTDAPRGAKPVRYLGGRPYNGAVTEYIAASASAIFLGDFVKMAAGGSVLPAAAGEAILGVCMGARYVDSNSSSPTWKPYLPSGQTESRVLVADDPDLVFVIQAAGVLSTAAVGGNADVLATNGNTTTGRSAHEIADASTTSSTRQLRVIGWHSVDGNDVTTANADWEVVVNEHYFKLSTGID